MKRHVLYILFLILFPVLSVLTACDSETITPEQENYDSQTGIAGEINNTSNSRIGVFYAGNLTKGTAPKVIENAFVALQGNNGNKPVNFVLTSQKYYHPEENIRIISGQRYTLQCITDEKIFTAALLIPDSFSLDAGIIADTALIIKLRPATNSKYNYVVELNRQGVGGQLYPLSVTDTESVTDNYIYNEIHDNGNKVFIRNREGIVETKVGIIRPFENEKIQITVRSVDDLYYTYLYNAEVQSGSEKCDIPLPCNLSKGAIGFVGAAFIRSVIL